MILITGASGFIGRHLVEALTACNSTAAIRLFDVQIPTGPLRDGIEVLSGAIEDPAEVSLAVQGAEVVIHLAAKVDPDSREIDQMSRVNVGGTRNVFAAAVQAKCKLFIHLSSAGIYGPPRGPDAFRESDPAEPASPYQRTKWDAEEALRRTDAKATILNILRPAGIYGAGSRLEIPAYRKILAQRWSIEFKGGVIVHPTYVGDVVQAIVAILERPAPHGTTFNVGGERPILLQHLQALVASVLNVPRHRIVLPCAISSPLVGLAGPILSSLGHQNPLLRGISKGHFFSSAVDDRLFRQCYPHVPIRALRDGLQEHIDWARANRLV